MVFIQDLHLRDGRTLRVHDSAADHELDSAFTVLWQHGSPQTGALLEPLLSAAAARGIRLVSYGRPGYGGSSALPGRDVAAAAADVEQLVDALGIARFAVMGASGGGPHALACAALLPGRVSAVGCLAGLAPLDADGFDWFAGMATNGASLRAALLGRAERTTYEETVDFDPDSFIETDYDALAGPWAALGVDVGLASAAGPEGLIDDDLAFVAPWGFPITSVAAPVLLVQGGRDRVVPPSHADWLSRRLPRSELWLRPDDGHISVLDACPAVMDWLYEHP